MIFVEIIFVKMASVKSKNGLRPKYLHSIGLRRPKMGFLVILLAAMVFVKSKSGLHGNSLRRNGLRQV
jgi:hypothetical protein